MRSLTRLTLEKSGSNHGSRLGDGIYFSSDPTEFASYIISTSSDSVDLCYYFYAPVVYDDYEGGVLLSVRQMSEARGGEHQVSGWNQAKKESGLGQRLGTLSGQTVVSSSATFDSSISEENVDDNQNTESSQFNFTENAPYTIGENRIENISAGSIRPVNGITDRENTITLSRSLRNLGIPEDGLSLPRTRTTDVLLLLGRTAYWRLRRQE